MTRSDKLLLIGVSAIVLTLCPTVAGAQVAGAAPGQTAGEPVAPDKSQIPDIVVTATKRKESLQDVPQSIQALGADQLKAQRITSVEDLAAAVPAFSFANTYSGIPVYTLRGVGFFDTSAGSYPTVSLYVDEVPLPFAVLTRHSDYDLERVEVLKGPQGTLFGQNATGGAINFIAAKPTDSFSAGADLSYGRFNEVVANGYVGGPLTDTLSIRIGGRYQRADGWQISNTRPDDRNGKIDAWMGRVTLAWAPTDRFKLSLNVNGWIDRSETQAAQVIAFDFQTPFVPPALAAQSTSPLTVRAADWTAGLPASDNRFVQVALRGEYKLTGDITLTSISSYLSYRQNQSLDADGLPITNIDILGNKANIDSYYQELRLDNGQAARVRWLIGANYQFNKTAETYTNNFSQSSAAGLGTFVGYTDVASTDPISSQKFNSYAAFANLDVEIAPKLTLTGGVRYTKSTDSAYACNRDPLGLPTGIGAFLFDLAYGGAFGPYTAQRCLQLNDLAVPIGQVQPGKVGALVDRLSENNISWKIGASWKPAPGVMLYANVSKGYKAGSFPLTGGTLFSQYLPVKQESVLAYEAGFKTTLLDRRLQLNGAVFYYDYRDRQTKTRVIDPFFGLLEEMQNIPKSRVKGGEISLIATPTEGLQLTANVTYTDAYIVDFSGINSAGVAADFAGAPLPYSSKWDVNAGANYDRPVSGALNAFAGVNLAYRSKAYAVIGGDKNPTAAIPHDFCLYCVAPYTLVGFNVGIHARDDRWRFSLWGKNILNSYYWNNVSFIFDTITRYPGKPATYGATIAARF